MPRLSALIVTFNSAPEIESCIESLAGDTDTPEIIVLDNASTDETCQIVRHKFPHVRLIQHENNEGFATGINRAFESSSGDNILILNPDVTPLPDCINILLKEKENLPDTGAVSPRQWIDSRHRWQWPPVPWPPQWDSLLIQVAGIKSQRFATGRIKDIWSFNRKLLLTQTSVEVPYLVGACILLSRHDFQKLGGLDHRFFLFFEDTDLSIRLREAGFRLYFIPEAEAVHIGNSSVRRFHGGIRDIYNRSLTRYLRLHGGFLTQSIWKSISTLHSIKSGVDQRYTQSIPNHGTSHTLLQWNACRGATDYVVEVSQDATFIYSAMAQTTDTQLAIPDELDAALNHGSFYWRVWGIQQDNTLVSVVPATYTTLDHMPIT